MNFDLDGTFQIHCADSQLLQFSPRIQLATGFLEITVEVKDEVDGIFDQYEVQIEPTNRYPNAFPICREVSNLIRLSPEWHVNSDSSFCITVPQIAEQASFHGITISTFIDKWLFPYLCAQSYRKKNGFYPGGEFAHGYLGTFQFYFDSISKNINEVFLVLNWLLSGAKPLARTNECFCGSRRKFRHCHKKAIENLKNISLETLEFDRNNMIKIVQFINMRLLAEMGKSI
jgi:hypothetical protein